MFSSLACAAADVPDTPAAAASTEPIGARNIPNYLHLVSVKRCNPTLLLYIEDDYSNMPVWIREMFETGKRQSTTSDGLACRMRLYTRSELVLAVKTLLYLSLCDSMGLATNWHLGPVWFSNEAPIVKKDRQIVATNKKATCVMISIIKTAPHYFGRSCGERFEPLNNWEELLDLANDSIIGLNKRDTLESLDSALDLLGTAIDMPDLSKYVVATNDDMIEDLRENSTLLAAGVYGITRKSHNGGLVYKASSAQNIVSSVREFINLAILTAKQSDHAPKLFSFHLYTPYTTKSTLFLTDTEFGQASTKMQGKALRIGTPATILFEESINGALTLTQHVRTLHTEKDHTTDNSLRATIEAVLVAIEDVLAREIVHADLHSSNILIQKIGEQYKAFILDFGEAGPLFDNYFEGLDAHDATEETYIAKANRYTQLAPETTLAIDTKDAALSDKTYSWEAAMLVAEIIMGRISLTGDTNRMLVMARGQARIRYREIVGSAITESRLKNENLRRLLDDATELESKSRIEFFEFKERLINILYEKEDALEVIVRKTRAPTKKRAPATEPARMEE